MKKGVVKKKILGKLLVVIIVQILILVIFNNTERERKREREILKLKCFKFTVLIWEDNPSQLLSTF